MDITISRAAAERPALPWDTVWDAAEGMGDWVVASASDTVNPAGLKADASIATAVILSLFQDRRAPDGWRPDVVDRRGWWGDLVSPEGEIEDTDGSWLWLLENETVSAELAERAKLYAEEALDWMIRDRVAGSVEVTVAVLTAAQGISLDIAVRAASGAQIYAQRFERLWRDVRKG